MARNNPEPAAPGSRRALLIAVCAAGLLVIAAAALLGYALRDSHRGIVGSALSSLIGGKFTLVDQNGNKFTEQNLKGKWQLVFFGFTHCADTCPTTLNELSAAFNKLPPASRSRIGVVFISVDPDRDTPAVMKAYVANFSAPITGLTGTPAEIAQVAKDFRVVYAKHPTKDGDYDVDHSALIYIMDPQGRFTASLSPDDTADQMVARLKKLLS